jgi:hypothetical protein
MSSVDARNKQAPGGAPLARLLRLVRELAEASVLVIAFAVAILVIGTPITLAVRVMHDIALWLVRSL